jgi:hypothetical protein
MKLRLSLRCGAAVTSSKSTAIKGDFVTSNSSNTSELRAISAPDLQSITAAVKVLQDVLLPYLHELSVDERRKLPKMGPKTVDFVAKTLSYAQVNPKFVPPFVDIDTYASVVAATDTLRALLQPLSLITRVLDDTLMLRGSEAYSSALSCYQTIKQAAKMQEFNAEKIYEDLSARFPGRPPKLPPAAPRAEQRAATIDAED